MAGCAAAPPAAEAPFPADGSDWVLSSLRGAPGLRASLSFKGDRIAGAGPCNQFIGDLARPGGGLALGPIAATRRACPEMAEEESYFSALTDAARAVERDGALILADADGAELMRFKPGL
ncbi:MAG: META domain-containing protein [Rubrimonas sp.]